MSTRPRTLLVLGDPAFAAAMAKYVGSRGFEPVLAKTSATALDICKDAAKENRPDVIVLSQLLPGSMDGVTLSQKIKETGREYPVIVIAAVASTAGLNDVRRGSGADQVLPSTFQPEMLILALRKLTTPAPPPGSTKGVAAAIRAGSTPSGGSTAAPAAKPPTPPPAAPSTPAPIPFQKAVSAPAGASPSLLGSVVMQSQTIQNSMKAAVPDAGPSKPVMPSPQELAVANTPSIPMDPAWLISRALVDNITGALRFVSGGVERIVYFAQGRPIVVTSNVPEERIGQILVRKGRLAPKELEFALNQTKKKNKRLAEIIVEMGIMTQRDHDEELAEQYTERLLQVFVWREASVEFRPYPAPDELVHIRLAPERIVAEGLRRYYDASRLEAALADPNRVLYPAPGAAERVPYLNLNQMEAAALLLIDGRRSIAEAVTQAPARIEALRAVYACVCLNLLV